MKAGPKPGQYAVPGFTKEQKDRARVAARRAIRRGELIPQPCGECIKRGLEQTRKINAHHEDYSKPLDVIWLCTLHHAFRHVQMRVEFGQQPDSSVNPDLAA